MSFHQTPLVVGYFSALIFAGVLCFRAWRNESPAHFWLGFLLFLMAMEIQDYTFGFSGINLLWEELNGFPRHFTLVFAPTVFFYLTTQTNQDYRWKSIDWLHFLPHGIYVLFGLILFSLGPSAVTNFQNSDLGKRMGWLLDILIWISYGYYFVKSLRLLRQFEQWLPSQFSSIQQVDLHWLKQFIYLVIFGQVFKWCWFLIDLIFRLPFEQDWWWQLFSVFLIFFVGINGLSQSSPSSLIFQPIEETVADPMDSKDYSFLREKLDHLMEKEEVYLVPELTLLEVSNRLKLSSSTVSAAINQLYQMNFNDFINQYRVKAFLSYVHDPKKQHLTLLALGLMAGFNSKATFNRVVKKVTGKSPKEFLITPTDSLL